MSGRGEPTRIVLTPAVTTDEVRSATVALIGLGLDLLPDADPHAMARDVADALGLLPDVPPARPSKGYRDARKPLATGQPSPHRQSPLTGRTRPFQRADA